jgi:hypothetical protein
MNKVSLFVKALSAMAIGLALINPAKANAQWIDLGRDALGQWGEAIRSNTVGRIAGQEFVGSMSKVEVDALKARYGGDYHAKITDWCNNKVLDRVGRNRGIAIVPGASSTWRVENNQANCYWRRFGSN